MPALIRQIAMSRRDRMAEALGCIGFASYSQGQLFAVQVRDFPKSRSLIFVCLFRECSRCMVNIVEYAKLEG
jgi:hypothetical protein